MTDDEALAAVDAEVQRRVKERTEELEEALAREMFWEFSPNRHPNSIRWHEMPAGRIQIFRNVARALIESGWRKPLGEGH